MLSTYPHKKMLITVDIYNFSKNYLNFVKTLYFIHFIKTNYLHKKNILHLLIKIYFRFFFHLFTYPHILLKLLKFEIKKERY